LEDRKEEEEKEGSNNALGLRPRLPLTTTAASFLALSLSFSLLVGSFIPPSVSLSGRFFFIYFRFIRTGSSSIRVEEEAKEEEEEGAKEGDDDEEEEKEEDDDDDDDEEEISSECSSLFRLLLI